MKVLWGRVVATVFALIGLVVLIKFWPAITAFLSTMERVGPGNPREEQMLGAVAFGLIGVVIVALVKILTHPGNE